MASMTTGRRFGGEQAREIGLVHDILDETDVVPATAELVRPLAGKDRGTLGAIKSTMFANAISALRATAGAW